jgi:hypothetical protein
VLEGWDILIDNVDDVDVGVLVDNSCYLLLCLEKALTRLIGVLSSVIPSSVYRFIEMEDL